MGVIIGLMTERILPDNARIVPKDAQLVFKGEIFDVYQWQQKMFDGSVAIFEMLRRPDTVLVIAIDDDQIVLLDEQQPSGIIESSRLPGGRVEPDESVLEGAKRELQEETGLQFAKWSLLEVTQPAIKIEWFVYIFIATEKIDQGPTKHDAGEKIEVKRVSFVDFKQLAGKDIESLEGIDTINELLSLRESI